RRPSTPERLKQRRLASRQETRKAFIPPLGGQRASHTFAEGLECRRDPPRGHRDYVISLRTIPDLEGLHIRRSFLQPKRDGGTDVQAVRRPQYHPGVRQRA